MKKVLLTGGSGFIGRNAISELLLKDYEVHVADIAPISGLHSGAILHECNLFDFQQQKNLLHKIKPTHLLHFAWYAIPGKFWFSTENMRWVQASLELLHNFTEEGGLRVVFAGTCAEYDWSESLCSEASTNLIPKTFYGICKNSLQQIYNSFCHKKSISNAWGRIFFLYGPYENPDRLVPYVILALLNGRKAFCTNGRQIRDFMHVSDVASAFVALLDSDVNGPVNIASGQAVEVKEIMEMIALKIKKPELLQLGALPFPENEPLILKADVQRLQKEVGWIPRFSLDKGLDNTIQWWKDVDKIR
jgi:nucleoside-diphosphate-sugar epimerase